MRLDKIGNSSIEHFKNNEFIDVSLTLMIFSSIFFAKSIFLGLIPSSADLLNIWPLFKHENIQIQNSLLTDVVILFEPWFNFNYVSIHNLQIPLWNPYCAGGVPHIANMESVLFFPSAWPIYLFGMTRLTLLLYYFLKIYLTGIFTYYYLKSIKLSYYSSLLGAIAFSFVGFMIVWLYWPLSNVIFILPASFYIIEKYISGGENRKYLLAQALIIALGIFAGHPETFFHIIVVSILYFLYKLISNKISIYEKIKLAENYIIFTLLGVAVSAIQLIPFLEYLFNSYAWAIRSNDRIMLDWHMLILNMMPDFYGSPSIYHKIPYYVSFTNYNESVAGYAGISMLCLAVFALITNHNSSLVRFYLLLSAWAIGVIYGLPLIFNFTVSLPLFSHANNTRLLFLLGFNIVILGSMGLDRIIEQTGEKEKRYNLNYFYISALSVLVLLFVLAYENMGFLFSMSSLSRQVIVAQDILNAFTCALIIATTFIIYILLKYDRNAQIKTAASISLIILVFAETGIHGMLYEPAIEGKYFYLNANPEAFSLINEKNELFRTTSIDPNSLIGSVYPVNTQMIYNIYDIRDCDGLEIKYYEELFKNLAEGRFHGWVDLFNVDKRFLDFMGVRWILSMENLSKEVDIKSFEGDATVGNLMRVEQEFISTKPNLTEIELLFDLPKTDELDENVTIELIEAISKKVVRSTKTNTKMVKTGKWYPFGFNPLNNSSNKEYIIKIETDARSTNGITLRRNDAGSELYINGILSPGSLCFNSYTTRSNPFDLFKIYPAYDLIYPIYYLYQNRDAMPRAFIVQEALFKENDSDILINLKNSSFDWRRTIIISGKGNISRFPRGESNISIPDYGPNYIKIQAKSSQPGFLVLSDAYYPGWKAYINGTETEIFRADYAFRTIKIGPGSHLIEFNYEPLSFYLGSIISLISLLILLKEYISKVMFVILPHK